MTAFLDELDDRLAVQEAHTLFGVVPPGLEPLLAAGLEALPQSEREAFVSAVTDAQAVLRDQCIRAAFNSGRAEYLCPPDVQSLVEYQHHRIRIKEGTE
jgi:hypothetical protein